MKAIVFFQGFTESDDSRTGSEDCYFRVIRHHLAPDVLAFLPRTWTTDVKDLARQLARQHVGEVMVLAYSHGQAAAVDFAKVCYKLGIYVDVMGLCDGVRRPDWVPRWNCLQWLSVRSLLSKGKIKIPYGVKRVFGVRQEESVLQGADIVAKDVRTEIEPLKWVRAGHTEIDQSAEWFSLVEQEITKWLDDE